MSEAHTPHERIAERAKAGPHTTKAEAVGFNGKVAILITNSVGTMWCAYAFALLALISLPDAIKAGTAALVAWIAQTFLQLVLLSVIMVGQKVSAAASDKQALQTYKDAEALLKIQDDVHRLIKVNNDLTAQIHAATCTAPKAPPKAPTRPTAAAKPKAAPRKR
jgi:ABC-type nickel/cobalt efflux system permease component RcnA